MTKNMKKTVLLILLFYIFIVMLIGNTYAATRTDENGNIVDSKVRYLKYDTDTAGIVGNITDTRVIQGPHESNFTASMPLAEIYIDDTVVNMSLWKNNQFNGTDVVAELVFPEGNDKYKGFVLNTDPNATGVEKNELSDSYGGLVYDFSKRYLNNTDKVNVIGTQTNYELFDGPIVKYTLKNMATKYDASTGSYKTYNVIITYSDILITICHKGANTTTPLDQSVLLSNSKLNLIDTNMVNICFDTNIDVRAGMTYKVNVQVVDPDTEELVSGSYYYPMVDIDVTRLTVGGFKNLYNAEQNARYSEQVALLSNYGRPTSGSNWEEKVWIPGGTWSANPVTTYANITEEISPYIAGITYETVDGSDKGLIFKPGGTSKVATGAINTATNGNVNIDLSFYTGFVTLANNTAGGINVKGWASALGTGGMESYVLTGSKIINNKVAASSGPDKNGDEGGKPGGTIYTTTTGNSSGDLLGGQLLGNSLLDSPYEISVATGQNVVYTMKPKEGYKVKAIYLKDDDIDVLSDFHNNSVSNISLTDFEEDENGNKLTYLGNGIYAYKFANIQENKSIHVEWETTELNVKKTVIQNEITVDDNFKFNIAVWNPNTTENVTYRVKAHKDIEDRYFTAPTNIEAETPFYMLYQKSDNSFYALGWDSSESKWITQDLDELGNLPDDFDAENTQFQWVYLGLDTVAEKCIYNVNSYNGTDYQYYLISEPNIFTAGNYVSVGTVTINNKKYQVDTTKYFVYIDDEEAGENAGKVLITNSEKIEINGVEYEPRFLPRYNTVNNASTNMYIIKTRTDTEYYDFTNLDSRYTRVNGETATYTITLPANETIDLSALTDDGWEIDILEVVGGNLSEFSLDDAMTSVEGVNKVEGTTNTFEFSLTNGQEIKFEGIIPMGWSYEITEVDDPMIGTVPGWEKISQTENSNISSFDGEEDVEFVNERTTKQVKLEKVWDDNNNSHGTRPDNITGFIKYILGEDEIENQTDGNWTKLENSWIYTFVISKFANIIDYGEIENLLNYTFTQNGLKEGTDDTYQMTNSLEYYTLTISKKVDGNIADENQEFNITVKILDNNNSIVATDFNATINGEDTVLTSTTSGIELKLKHNDVVIIKNIIKNYTCEVEEEDTIYDEAVTVLNTEDNSVIDEKVEERKVNKILDKSITVEYVNTLKGNDITIKKEVEGNAADENKEFNIVAKIFDENGNLVTGKFTVNKNGEDEEVTSTENGIELKLKHNDVVVIKNIINKYTCEIEEEDTIYEEFVTVLNLDDNSIIEEQTEKRKVGTTLDKNVTIEFLNKLFGNDITIKKEVEGNAADENKEFNIVAKIFDENGNLVTGKFTVNKNGEDEEITSTENGIELKLKHNDVVVIKNIINKYTCEIEEEDTIYEEFVTVLNLDDNSIIEEQTEKRKVGTTLDKNVTIEFLNKLFGNDITIKKEVAGNASDENKEFEFTVKIYDENGNIVTGKFNAIKNGEETEVISTENGIELKLKHNDNITIRDIALGYKFEIEEENTEYTESYNVTNADNNVIINTTEGLKYANTVDKDYIITFTNNLEKNEEPGDSKPEETENTSDTEPEDPKDPSNSEPENSTDPKKENKTDSPEQQIDNEEKKHFSPQTGDKINNYIIMLVLSLLGMWVSRKYRKK